MSWPRLNHLLLAAYSYSVNGNLHLQDDVVRR
jgi:hypothetical protein